MRSKHTVRPPEQAYQERQHGTDNYGKKGYYAGRSYSLSYQLPAVFSDKVPVEALPDFFNETYAPVVICTAVLFSIQLRRAYYQNNTAFVYGIGKSIDSFRSSVADILLAMISYCPEVIPASAEVGVTCS